MYLSSQFQGNPPQLPFSLTHSDLTDPKASVAYEIYSRVSAEKRGSLNPIHPHDESNFLSGGGVRPSGAPPALLADPPSNLQYFSRQKPLLNLETDEESEPSDDASILQEIENYRSQAPSQRPPPNPSPAQPEQAKQPTPELPTILSPYVEPSSRQQQSIDPFAHPHKSVSFTLPADGTTARETAVPLLSAKIEFSHIGATEASPKIKAHDFSSEGVSSSDEEDENPLDDPQLKFQSMSVQEDLKGREQDTPQKQQRPETSIGFVTEASELREKTAWFLEIQGLLSENGYAFNLFDNEHGFSHAALKTALSVVVRDTREMASQLRKYEDENKQKSVLLESQTQTLAHTTKVKNKAVKKYKALKQKCKETQLSLQPLLAELGASKYETEQFMKIVKQQEAKLQEVERDCLEKKIKIDELENLFNRRQHVHAQQQDIQRFKLDKRLSELPGVLQNEVADYIAARREESLEELHASRQKCTHLTRQNQMLFRKNQELLARQLQLAESTEKLEKVLRGRNEDVADVKAALEKSKEELKDLEIERQSWQREALDLRAELGIASREREAQGTLKRKEVVSLYQMSNEECRKIVSEILRAMHLRDPGELVGQILQRERALKSAYYMELVLRKLAGEQDLGPSPLCKDAIFAVQAEMLKQASSLI